MPLLTQGLGRKLQATRKGITGLLADGAASEAYGLLGGIYPASGPSLKRGVKDILDGYSEMPWLRAVAGKVATEVASTCWYLYKPSNRERSRSLRIVQRAYGDTRHRLVKRNMQDGAFEAVDDHVLLTALSNANSFLVGHNLFHLTQIHLDLAGEAFWIKERNRLGVPVGFWPIPPSWVKSTPSISKPWFDVQWSGWKGKIPHTEIVWYVDPNPADPYGRGSGLALTLADELETDEYAARHTKMVFLNRARPDLIVWPEESKFDSGTISDANARRLGEMWRAEHQGFWRTALPFFSTRKLGVKELGQSMRDLAVTDLRKHERDMIVQVWGMPPEEMGIIENSNRSTIEAADFLFKRNVIVPRLERLRAYMQERLIPEYDDRLVIEYDSPVEADRDRHMKAAETAPWALTVDEWREMAGHDPLPDDGGKFHMVDLRTQPRPDLRYEAPPVTLAGNPSLTGEVQDEADDDDDDDESAAGTRSVKRSMSRRVRALTDDPDDLPELSRRWASREPAVRRSLEDGFVRLREDTTLADVQRLIESGSPAGAGDVLPLAAWGQRMEPEAAEWLEAVFRIGVAVGGDAAGLQTREPDPVFNRVNPYAVNWAHRQAAALVVGIGEATMAGLRASVATALELGWHPTKLARLVRETVGLTDRQAAAVIRFAQRIGPDVSEDVLKARVARYAKAQLRLRSITIARTELAKAASAGQQTLWDMALKEGSIERDTMEKIWIVTQDEALEARCEALGAETVAVDGVFSNGLSGPPDHPNCRCATGLQRASKAAPAPAPSLSEVVTTAMAPLGAAIGRIADAMKSAAPPVVHVAAPEVTVQVPAPRPVTRTRSVEHDEAGLITRIVDVETPEP